MHGRMTCDCHDLERMLQVIDPDVLIFGVGIALTRDAFLEVAEQLECVHGDVTITFGADQGGDMTVTLANPEFDYTEVMERHAR